MNWKDRVVLVSHHPVWHSTSPTATVYENWISSSSNFRLQAFIGTHDRCTLPPSDAAKTRINDWSSIVHLDGDAALDSRYEESLFLFNSLQSFLTDDGLSLLSTLLNSNRKVAIYWHETAWNLRALFERAGDNGELARHLISTSPILHLVPTRQSIHPLVMLFGLDPTTFNVVMEIVNTERFYPRQKREKGIEKVKTDPPLIIGSGVVSLRKGVDLFSKLASELQQSASFRWIGDSSKKAGEIFDFSSFQHQPFTHDFPAVLREGDCFVLTSRDDPSPLVAFEALASGLPVICFASTGIAEVIPSEFVAHNYKEMRSILLAMINSELTLDRADCVRIAKKFDRSEFQNKLRSISYEENHSRPVPELKTTHPVGRPPTRVFVERIEKLQKALHEYEERIRSIENLKRERSVLKFAQDLGARQARSELRRIGRGYRRTGSSTCVVVGNSPSLLNRNHGKQIDNFDVIVRLNDFSLLGFEESHGSRADLWLFSAALGQFNHANLLNSKLLKGICFSGRPSMRKEDQVARLIEGGHEDWVNSGLIDFRVSLPLNVVLQRALSFDQSTWASTGLAAIYFMLFALEFDTVHTCGFDFYKNDKPGFRTSYIGKSSRADNAHNFVIESQHYDELIQAGKILPIDV